MFFKDDKKLFFHLFLVVHFCQGKNMGIFLKIQVSIQVLVCHHATYKLDMR